MQPNSRLLVSLCGVLAAYLGCASQPSTPAPLRNAEAETRKEMANVAIAFAEALGRRDFDAASKLLMGPEVCADAKAEQRTKCQHDLAQQNADIRAALPQLAADFAPGFRVKDVSFEPLPGAGALPGATVHLQPSAKDQPAQALMIGVIHGKAYVMIAMRSPEPS